MKKTKAVKIKNTCALVKELKNDKYFKVKTKKEKVKTKQEKIEKHQKLRRKHECNICHKKYNSSGNLKEHIDRH